MRDFDHSVEVALAQTAWPAGASRPLSSDSLSSSASTAVLGDVGPKLELASFGEDLLDLKHTMADAGSGADRMLQSTGLILNHAIDSAERRVGDSVDMAIDSVRYYLTRLANIGAGGQPCRMSAKTGPLGVACPPGEACVTAGGGATPRPSVAGGASWTVAVGRCTLSKGKGALGRSGMGGSGSGLSEAGAMMGIHEDDSGSAGVGESCTTNDVLLTNGGKQTGDSASGSGGGGGQTPANKGSSSWPKLFECSPPLQCRGSVCKPPVPLAKIEAAVGGACSRGADCDMDGNGALVCGSDGTCTRDRDIGDVCRPPDAPCKDGFVCPPGGGMCVGGKGAPCMAHADCGRVPPPARAAGEGTAGGASRSTNATNTTTAVATTTTTTSLSPTIAALNSLEHLICYEHTCEPPHPIGEICQDQNHCEVELNCVSGVCVPGGGTLGRKCGGTRECREGLHCTDGACAFGNGDRLDACESDRDCGELLVCKGGLCEKGKAAKGDVCRMTRQCEDPLECAPPDEKATGIWQGKNGHQGSVAGSLPGSCDYAKGPLGSKCRTTRACAPGLRCGNEKKCAFGAGETGDECRSTRDCTATLVCTAGRCGAGILGPGEATCVGQRGCASCLTCSVGAGKAGSSAKSGGEGAATAAVVLPLLGAGAPGVCVAPGNGHGREGDACSVDCHCGLTKEGKQALVKRGSASPGGAGSTSGKSAGGTSGVDGDGFGSEAGSEAPLKTGPAWGALGKVDKASPGLDNDMAGFDGGGSRAPLRLRCGAHGKCFLPTAAATCDSVRKVRCVARCLGKKGAGDKKRMIACAYCCLNCQCDEKTMRENTEDVKHIEEIGGK